MALMNSLRLVKSLRNYGQGLEFDMKYHVLHDFTNSAYVSLTSSPGVVMNNVVNF